MFFVFLLLVSFAVSAGPIKQEMHPERMIFLIDQALEQNDFLQAAALIERFKIRVVMDASCCMDDAAADAIYLLAYRKEQNPKFQELEAKISPMQNYTIFRQQLMLVEDALNAGTLPVPYWIAPYGIKKHEEKEIKDEELFPSPDECKKARQEILEFLKENV